MGWLVRTVEDATLLLQVMAGPDPMDPVSSRGISPNYLEALAGPAAPRIGLIRQFFYDHADVETRRHVDDVAERLREAGAAIEEVSLPDSMATAFDDQQTIMVVEGAAFHQPMFEQRAGDYQPRLREMIGRGLATDAATYSRALERRRQFITDMELLSEKVDVLLTPSTPTPPLADLTSTGNPLFQGPWTSCGLPAISIPSGIAESGLPLGVQLIAAPFAEARLLEAASWSERALNFQSLPLID